MLDFTLHKSYLP